jgi:hypothetical protein
MMSRRPFANVVGCAAIVCSFAFWAEVCATKILGYTPGWLDMGFDGWLIGWVLGILLALTAAALGSRRWALAAILPFVSFFAAAASIDWPHVQW